MNLGWIITSLLHGGLLLIILISLNLETKTEINKIQSVKIKSMPIAKVKQIEKNQNEEDLNLETKTEIKLKEDQLILDLLDKLNKDSIDFSRLNSLDYSPANSKLKDIKKISLNKYELNQFKNQIVSCWSIPVNIQKIDNIIVNINFKLNRSAEVIGIPKILNKNEHPSFIIIAESAVNAILKCGPYHMLPLEKFATWNTVFMEFNPKDIY